MMGIFLWEGIGGKCWEPKIDLERMKTRASHFWEEDKIDSCRVKTPSFSIMNSGLNPAQTLVFG